MKSELISLFEENLIYENNIKRKERLEKLLSETNKELQNDFLIPDQIDEEWLINFSNAVKETTNPVRLNIYKAMLINVIKQSIAVSISTINFVKYVDIQLLNKIYKNENYIFNLDNKKIFINNGSNFGDPKYSFSLIDVSTLIENKIITDIEKSITLDDVKVALTNSKYVYFLTGKSINIPIYIISDSISQVINLMQYPKNLEPLSQDELKQLFSRRNGVKVALHLRIDNNRYKTEPLYEVII